jgi:glycosyltransferase 2 family protein
MQWRGRRWWRLLKIVVAVAIVAAIGRQFARDLRELDSRNVWHSLRPGWLVLSGALYVAGLACWSGFWRRLMEDLGQRPAPFAALRAYFLGLPGKYLPGKAWSLVFQAGLVSGRGVRAGVAGMAAFYMVLVCMASGALVAVVLFAVFWPQTGVGLGHGALRQLVTLTMPQGEVVDGMVLVLLSLVLLAVIGVFIVPGVFNRLAHRLSLPFRQADADALPRVRVASLLEGLAIASTGWLLFGLSLAAALEGMMDRPPGWSLERWGHYTACTALSYVAGFIIVVVPGGLGVREFFLVLFLVPEMAGAGLASQEARATAIVAVIVLRVVWTAAEVVMAGAVYWLPAFAGSR